MKTKCYYYWITTQAIFRSRPLHSHRLQPLDVGVFGPFKTALKVAFYNFNIEHPGKPLTIKNIGML